jgi:ring-1,2-phenylacetyl-CoA epoxidase subunit PaaD
MVTLAAGDAPAAIRALLTQVVDPEIPSLTIADMGILREVRCEDGRVVVTITPTYSGCPAMDVIAADIRRTLDDAGHPDVRIETRLAPAWTTDWLSPAARDKLHAAGIAPPAARCGACRELVPETAPPCPRCGAPGATQVSRYGATACKALYRCRGCGEPFEYFKPF